MSSREIVKPRGISKDISVNVWTALAISDEGEIVGQLLHKTARKASYVVPKYLADIPCSIKSFSFRLTDSSR